MILYSGQSNRVWHYWAGLHEAGKHPHGVGVMLAPSYFRKVPIDPWMPFVVDNGAFIAWRDGLPWDVWGWREMLKMVKMRGVTPAWAAIPDAVGDKKTTLERWGIHAYEIQLLNWPTAFCVQDGMTPKNVPSDADVVFVGGTDGWKYPNLPLWCEHFARVHCARVNSPEMFERCAELGCESIDGTGWFMDPSRQDKLPALQRFLSGHRNRTPTFTFLKRETAKKEK